MKEITGRFLIGVLLVAGSLARAAGATYSDDSALVTVRETPDSPTADDLLTQLREMQLREVELRLELEKAHQANHASDSLQLSEQRRMMDSLRAVTPAVPVVVDGDTLFSIYAGHGGLSPARRAANAEEIILQVGKDLNFGSDTLGIVNGMSLTDIMYGEKVIFSVNEQDARWMEMSRQELAELYFAPVSIKIAELKKEHSIEKLFKRIGLFVLVLVVQAILFYLTNYLFRRLRRHIIRMKTQDKLKPLTIRGFTLFNVKQETETLILLSRVLKWALIVVQLVFSVPMLLAIFPQTKAFAETLFDYAFEPIKMIFLSVINYIPNLFKIAIIYLCIHYIVKGIRFFAREIESERMKIAGFYPDWAHPTFNIIRFLLYAFMIAVIYQYLPGSDSDIFKAISVFVGLVISLGSTTVIGNILAGFVITYMRPFKVGDRIKLNDTTEGHVVEKSPFVTRIRTPKNEVVTIPNSLIMSSNITNHSASARTYGLIIHLEVGFGFSVPWQQVHRLLIKAALETPCVLSEPEPFVLELELKDSYPVYQINAYVKEVDTLPKVYSDLNQHIHDVFQEAGLELILPHYYAQRDGNPMVMPPEYLKK